MQQSKNVYNFNAGPAALPSAVLDQAKLELTNFNNSGMSVMELSHRSNTYEEVHNATIDRMKQLLAIPDDYEVVFVQGGASLQFAMIPYNFLRDGKEAGYILTGSWSEKALAETKYFGTSYEVASTKNNEYRNIPTVTMNDVKENSAYVHVTSNNTIYGTQWKQFPQLDVPLIADMSSDIMSKPIDVSQFDLIYAGAQKNLGPSGVTVVIVKKELLEQANDDVPTMLSYATHVDKNSLYNTPPTFGIYMLGEVLKWIELQGGLHAIATNNEEKAAIIYDTIDASNGFYVGHAEKESRSLMNITFRLEDEQLEIKFLQEAAEAGFVGLNGHRSVGGCRASTYNAVPHEACLALSEFMKTFQQKNG